MTYMFVFSVTLDGLSSMEKFYSSLEEIPVRERMFTWVYPVRFKGSDYRLHPERIRYRSGSWHPDEVEWSESWLRIIMADPVEELEILRMDVTEVVIYNEMAFQTTDDLIDYLIDYLTERGEIRIEHLHNLDNGIAHSEDTFSVTNRLDSELTPYPSPPTERSSLYWDEMRRLDQELDRYHKDNCCTKC